MLKTNASLNRSFPALFALVAFFLIGYLWNESVQAQTVSRSILIQSAFSDSTKPLVLDQAALLAEPEAPKITLSGKYRRLADKFVERNSESLALTAKRCTSSFKTIDAIFRQHGLPVELKYLAVVESNLKTTAVSHCGATGVWQLMPETARLYGLKIGRRTDERRHLSRSTVAAARYISDLYAEFGDWLLVVAAYNGGSGSVMNAIKRSGSRNYYVLHRYLPAETKAHVEHFIATHYYFEGKGSLVTLTKAETGKYVQSISDYLSRRSCELEEERATAILATAAAVNTTSTGRE
ncbi:MAG: lytic transglycosylase protein [Flaviaesturariibacter sp.]|nr:lytic transglycosylase protein [Flaviaesturariibacter sp.]